MGNARPLERVYIDSADRPTQERAHEELQLTFTIPNTKGTQEQVRWAAAARREQQVRQ